MAHIYKARIRWAKDEADFASGRYSRLHHWEFDEGVSVRASSSPLSVRLPFSAADAVDPEEALVAATSSCHMLFFLNFAQKAGFLIDSSITNVTRRLTDQWVEITCEVSFVVGRLPSRAMVMMTSGGATVQAPRAGMRPDKEKALQIDALEGAVQGAHENLLAFLKTQKQM